MWIYSPDPQIPLYRATLLARLSPWNVPSDEYWSILVESAYMTGKRSPYRLTDVLEGLTRLCTLDRDARIVDTWKCRTQYGYPVPSVDRDENLAALLAKFEAHGIYSRGRFGLWRYEVSNQDQSFLQRVEVVDHILEGTPERVAKEGLGV
jgi:hypothetical protein